MVLSQQRETASRESLIAAFFRKTAGTWRSERRYYTLPDGDTNEGLTMITNRFLEAGSEELIKLAELHELSDPMILSCGAYVSWKSEDAKTGRPTSKGSTIFGASGEVLYRDRGFATTKPITADYHFNNPDTLSLRTEYQGSVFEEEIKLIGSQYRTRQSVISRAGEQVLIGQYLEKRQS